MWGISMVVTERCIEITTIHAAALTPPLNDLSDSVAGTQLSDNRFWSVLFPLPTVTSVKFFAFHVKAFFPSANPQGVLSSALAGETKERATRDEMTKARENIVFL
jgi:hypothetical protein